MMRSEIDPDGPWWGFAAAALVIVAACMIWLVFVR